MKLADLSKPQWDAALNAARLLMSGSPHSQEDRASYRVAVGTLVMLLPDETDAREIIKAAARWDMLNDIAAVCAGLPTERIDA